MQTRKRLHFSATRRSQAQVLLLVGDGAGQIVYCSCYDTADERAPDPRAQVDDPRGDGTLATALNLTISLQETISLSWWGEGRAPHPGSAGWPTLALEAAILSTVALWGGYKAAARSGPLAIDALIIVSAALAIFGLVVYSRMAPVSDLRIPDDLRSRASHLFFAFIPELAAQLIAQMVSVPSSGGFSQATSRASKATNRKAERPTAAP